MRENPTILIADRNSHVRMFLMREMMAEGYRVKMVSNGANLLKMIFEGNDIDLLILDPDLPGVDLNSILEDLDDRIPPLPVVLHTHLRHDNEKNFLAARWVVIIEKSGDSVERIKEAAGKLLQEPKGGTCPSDGFLRRGNETP